jgi:5-methylcytosine-specific restriction endonuclease McrA
VQRAIGAAARKANRDARRAADPRVQLGHFRANGEAPSTVSGARLILKDTLLALLLQRCEDQGLRRDSVQYSVKYNTNPAFRANEKAKTAGQKKKRGVLVSPDGSLTPQVIRRLFATTSTCPYCQKLLSSRGKELDHLTPVSRGGTHTLGNVTVCCKSCNSRKRNKPLVAWLASLPPHIAARFTRSRAA